MNRRENEDAVIYFATEVLPGVAKVFPQVRFYVVGTNPSKRVRGLGSKDPRIVVTGYVERPSTYFRRAALAVAPLRLGGGIKVKVLECLAHGLPMVLSPVAAEGIGGAPGRDYLVCERTAEYVESVCKLLSDRAFADAVGKAGNQLVETKFNFERSLDHLVDFCRQVAKAKRYCSVAGPSERKHDSPSEQCGGAREGV